MSKVLKLMRLTTYSHPALKLGILNRGDTIKVDDDLGAELLEKGPENEEGDIEESKKYFIELPALSPARYDYTVDPENAKSPPPTRVQRSLAQNVPNDKTTVNVQGQTIPSLSEEESRNVVGEVDAGTTAELQADPAETHHPQDSGVTTDAMGNDITGKAGTGEEGGEEGTTAHRPAVRAQRTRTSK